MSWVVLTSPSPSRSTMASRRPRGATASGRGRAFEGWKVVLHTNHDRVENELQPHRAGRQGCSAQGSVSGAGIGEEAIDNVYHTAKAIGLALYRLFYCTFRLTLPLPILRPPYKDVSDVTLVIVELQNETNPQLHRLGAFRGSGKAGVLWQLGQLCPPHK